MPGPCSPNHNVLAGLCPSCRDKETPNPPELNMDAFGHGPEPAELDMDAPSHGPGLAEAARHGPEPAELDMSAPGHGPEPAELATHPSGHGSLDSLFEEPAKLDMDASGHGPAPAELGMDASGHGSELAELDIPPGERLPKRSQSAASDMSDKSRFSEGDMVHALQNSIEENYSATLPMTIAVSSSSDNENEPSPKCRRIELLLRGT